MAFVLVIAKLCATFIFLSKLKIFPGLLPTSLLNLKLFGVAPELIFPLISKLRFTLSFEGTLLNYEVEELDVLGFELFLVLE